MSRYDNCFDINRHCDLIRCISQQGARGRIDGTGQRRPIYVVVKTYLHFLTWDVANPRTTKPTFLSVSIVLVGFHAPRY